VFGSFLDRDGDEDVERTASRSSSDAALGDDVELPVPACVRPFAKEVMRDVEVIGGHARGVGEPEAVDQKAGAGGLPATPM